MDFASVSSRKMGLYGMVCLYKLVFMSEDASPYTVSKSGMAPVSPPQMPGETSTPIPKVFGIIHICYAVFGMVFSFFGIVGIVLMRKFVANGGEEFKELGTVVNAWEGMTTYLYVDVALKLVLGVVLLVAGIGLLRKKAWSVKVSMVWSISRAVAAIGMLVWGLSVAAEFQEKLAPVKDAQQAQIQQVSQGVGNVLGIVFILIYPVVSLIFLSKKSVRDSLN